MNIRQAAASSEAQSFSQASPILVLPLRIEENGITVSE
jgi:hypothetical protein